MTALWAHIGNLIDCAKKNRARDLDPVLCRFLLQPVARSKTNLTEAPG
jgi:hypothetical protein